ncbi:uncharacterized protein PHACADRAFT_208167 [Phanerochaete carnosa HHB-10118-sp]|uniref:F-box domain-containing protein n=1 Tax=Phanerochaete carnosa (strain HHB-10118-sp) TaxID=650164 RepID=K5V356_PHACS|nr:uncharacterized protein PHACADRAFT_208167 [Phanerochaete carnosa HHB-10118-sp]EKM57001.1 hypothetical protein PHACADRAFT_208167 [Phanerochaete carnosa HHB-10118-sp]
MTSDTTVTARHIPQELFATIIRHLIPPEHQLFRSGRHKKRLKRELGQCSLVCRYWAIHCRPAIFTHIELQTPEDAYRLLELAKTTSLGISVGMYISDVTIRATVSSLPWIHLITNTTQPRDLFPNMNSYRVYIQSPFSGPQEMKPFAPRSAFHSLPRSLPSPLKHLVSLELKDLRFATFADFISFLDSLITPDHGSRNAPLSLHRVTWADHDKLTPLEIPVAFRGVRRRWKKYCTNIVAVRCTAVWPLIWLQVTAQRPRPPPTRMPPFVHPAETYRLVALVQITMDECECTACAEHKSERVTLGEVEPGKDFPDCTTLRIRNTVHDLIFCISLDGHVVNICFHLRVAFTAIWQSDEPPESLRLDWTALDQRAAAFNGSMLSVWIPDGIYDEYEPFVRAHMPMTESHGRLKLEREVPEA